jgi:hypothetical protein
MNLGKTIKELTNRLDVVYPYSSSTCNESRHDGINYWKGKKIILAKKWNEIYEKNSIYTDNYRITLISNKPLQYFPDDYNGSISSFNEELKKEAQKWNKEYYELLEFRKNPTLGRNKCSQCIFSAHLDDPLFVGIEKVVARIVSNHCKNNNDNFISNTDNDFLISYPCRVMNFFQCPFERKENSSNTENNKLKSKYPYKREDLFFLQRVAFAIEQAISIFHETTKNNEIIYEVDFENDRAQEIHTNCNGEPCSWGWNDLNVKEQLSKVKPISTTTIQIINEMDIYNILTNREKLEYLLQEYYNKEEQEYQELEQIKNKLKEQIREKLQKQNEEEQQILSNKENRKNIIDFIVDNKNSIRVEDLKIYEPFYKCYREKGNCHICNTASNIICTNCCNSHKEIWLCTKHWQQHEIEKHE